MATLFPCSGRIKCDDPKRMAGKYAPSFLRPRMPHWPINGATHPMRKTRSEGFFVATLAHDPANLPAACHALERPPHRLSKTPTAFPPRSPISTCTCMAREPTTKLPHAWARTLSSARASRAFASRVWAPNARGGQRGRRVQRVGQAPPSHAPAHRRRLGNLHARSWPGHQLQILRSAPSRAFRQLKADPYGFAMEVPPKSASVVWDLETYQWNDQPWMETRAHTD